MDLVTRLEWKICGSASPYKSRGPDARTLGEEICRVTEGINDDDKGGGGEVQIGKGTYGSNLNTRA